MTTVIKGNFGQKEELVYECVNCNGQSFWLNEDGSITCKTCSIKQAPPVEWIELLLDNAKENLEEDE